MPSLNNYNNTVHMASNIPLCKTNKEQKSMSFLGPKIWHNSNINTSTNTASLMHGLKKEILEKSH